MPDIHNDGDSRQYITFVANGQEFASLIITIREIRGWNDTTPLPHAPDYVRGIINLRGLVLPVIDLKARLGLGLTETTTKHVIIVINTGAKLTGILVDAVSDIITLSAGDIQPPPELMGDGESTFVDGIAVRDGRMVTLLSMAELTGGTVN